MELLDFTEKREAAGVAAKYNRLNNQNKAAVMGYTAGLLRNSYDFETLHTFLSLQDKRTIENRINGLTMEQTQRGATY